MVQSFIVRGWLDNHEWGDEPPDPDDIWTEGDRVRLKSSTAEGTVKTTESQPFLGGYLPYVRVLWDGKKVPVPIEPDLLIRLSRTLPEELTWQAPQGFSDFAVPLAQAMPFTENENAMTKTITFMTKTITLPIEHEVVEPVSTLQKFKPGDKVYVKRGTKRIERTVGDRIGTGKNSAKILTLGGRSGNEEYWELPARLELCQLTVETALLQPEELLSVLDYQASATPYTIALFLEERYEENQVAAVLAQLEKEGKAEKTICGDGKSFTWRKTSQKQEDEGFLNKICSVLLPGDGVSDWEIVKLLEYEFALIQIQQALKQLESQGRAIKSNFDGGVVWKSLQSSISALVLDSATPQQLQSSANTSYSLDSVKSTTTAEVSSHSDILELKSFQTSETLRVLVELEPISFQPASLANPSASPENGTGQSTNVTSFQPSLESLTNIDPSVSPLKMSPASSPVPTSPENPPEDFLGGCFGSFTAGGTMYNGKLLEAPTLALPLLGKDLFWLRSPQALSSTSATSRPPGQTKLEVQLKELKLIGNNQVINPEFLARGLYGLPANWASLSVSAPAREILGISAKHTETALTLELPAQHSITSRESNKQDSLQPVPMAQQKISDCFIQSDLSSFEWQGVGYYWIYPESVEMDLGTQCRVGTDRDTVKYYTCQMKDDLWEWEASIVGLLWDGDQLLPYDGHHRLKAAIAAGKMILARIDEGNLSKAIALSCGSNKKPSLRRTREDNQKTIQMVEDLRVANGDEWLLNIINAELPVDKHFKEVSLRAIEFYTGIPFRTIGNMRKRKESTSETFPKISFLPTEEEMKLIENIMEAEGFESPASALKWLLEEYKNS